MANVCAIVGVGPGIGLAVARRFGRGGFRLALMARRKGVLDEHASMLRHEGLDALGFPANAADAQSLAEAFGAVRAELGAPSVLVYNAAVLREAPPSRLDPADLLLDLRVNVGGCLTSVHHVVSDMRHEARGTILLTGGGLSLDPWPQFSSLAIGKAGLRNLAVSLAKELEPDGIHVATVTITGLVKVGTRFDPNMIAEQYWMLHAQPRAGWQREVIYR